ncbi:twin transmembrane helix small protein [Chitinivorax sp. B]|uniref:twin transmembrane helix small protein n=1 Tax=Chitinivorax sp. B TaxID=2502235 RepID=UPI0010F434EB|nr:twin transmembrane helix small protein [Chitinivorax sp. B]
MKIVVVLMLVAILFSLFTALRGVLKRGGSQDKAVKALTLRVALSISLFVLLMVGFYFGLIPTTGL